MTNDKFNEIVSKLAFVLYFDINYNLSIPGPVKRTGIWIATLDESICRYDVRASYKLGNTNITMLADWSSNIDRAISKDKSWINETKSSLIRETQNLGPKCVKFLNWAITAIESGGNNFLTTRILLDPDTEKIVTLIMPIGYIWDINELNLRPEITESAMDYLREQLNPNNKNFNKGE